ncbi:flagellar hook-length control protein FliK [Sphingomonas sp. GB1N7]|uniref:flagellar hook-length control protein FliK n=1 Tax=Parasphingomonas caseinilytica TaxID=3096158 RepID=UPI002FC67F23
MIALSTSVSPPPPKGVPVPPASAATGDFPATLAGLTDASAKEKTFVSPGLPSRTAKPGLPDVSRSSDPGTPVSLAAFLDGAAGDAAPVALPGAKGQDVAANGKTLPADPADEDASKDVIWLPTAFALPIQLPVSQPRGLPKFGGPVAPAGGDVPPAAGPVLTMPAPIAPDILVAGDGGKPPALTMPAQVAPDVLIAGDAGPSPTPRTIPVSVSLDIQKVDVPLRTDATAPVAIPNARTQAAVAQPAGQVFAAAIASVVQQARRDEREPIEQRTPTTIAATALEALHVNAITATADAKHAALDLKQDSGLQGMIDHIETLRDGADANDTRIRLVPDALGAVDVSVRKDGERVHVHFAAENRASAQLLSDAQPRLAELAEARGVKLGQTSVDSGQGQARQQHQPNPILSTRPASARRTADLDTTDSRIA